MVTGSEATLVTLGSVTEWPVALALVGLAAIVALEDRRVPGAVLICILVLAGAGWALGLAPTPESVVAPPPSLAPTALQLDLLAAVELGLLAIVFAFLMVDLFDTGATLVAVLTEAGLTDSDGRVPRMRRALVADSTATMAGALLGTSTTTSYVESAAGVRAGGRTGLTAVVVAALFLLSTFIAPVATAVPAFATAPAIMFVGYVLTRSLGRIGWDDLTECIPAMVTALAMPFTFSIATGIGLGFISYASAKVLAGRASELNSASVAVALAFLLRFALM